MKSLSISKLIAVLAVLKDAVQITLAENKQNVVVVLVVVVCRDLKKRKGVREAQ